MTSLGDRGRLVAVTTSRSPLGATVLALLLLTASVGTWWAWLGWDHDYYTDATTGEVAGPYRPWQVVGCVLTLLALALVAHALLHPVVVGVAMTVGFSAGFASTALPEDESGLAMVGVVLVVLGMSLASVVLGLLAVGVRRAVRQRHVPPRAPSG